MLSLVDTFVVIKIHYDKFCNIYDIKLGLGDLRDRAKAQKNRAFEVRWRIFVKNQHVWEKILIEGVLHPRSHSIPLSDE